jgi:hypothetical protein
MNTETPSESSLVVGKAIAAALVKAQAAYGPALKSSQNPHFKNKYADLSACVDAVANALNSNGIAFMQRVLPCESGVAVETVFIHTSGETLSSGTLHVPVQKNDAQGYGSALTYARRYSLMSACGIAPEDDDGNAATKATTYDKPQKPSPHLTDEPTKDKSNGQRPARVAAAIEEDDRIPF